MKDATKAYHEAGHAVMATALGIHLVSVTIKASEDRAAGVCLSFFEDLEPLQRRELNERRIMICLAGGMAQRRFAPRSVRPGHSSEDWETAIQLAARATGSLDPKEVRAFLKWLEIRTRSWMTERMWYAVQKLAEVLLKQKAISGKAAEQIARKAWNEHSNTQARR